MSLSDSFAGMEQETSVSYVPLKQFHRYVAAVQYQLCLYDADMSFLWRDTGSERERERVEEFDGKTLSMSCSTEG